jgi:hypothetical protein
MEKALSELYKLIDLDTGPKRKMALDEWREKWVKNMVGKQLVVNKEAMTAEYKDGLIYIVARQLVENLMDECIKVSVEDKCIKAEINVIRREMPND